jgi:hypothetical protein
MKRHDAFTPTFYDALALETVHTMFEMTWHQFMSVLSSTISQATVNANAATRPL